MRRLAELADWEEGEGLERCPHAPRPDHQPCLLHRTHHLARAPPGCASSGVNLTPSPPPTALPPHPVSTPLSILWSRGRGRVSCLGMALKVDTKCANTLSKSIARYGALHLQDVFASTTFVFASQKRIRASRELLTLHKLTPVVSIVLRTHARTHGHSDTRYHLVLVRSSPRQPEVERIYFKKQPGYLNLELVTLG